MKIVVAEDTFYVPGATPVIDREGKDSVKARPDLGPLAETINAYLGLSFTFPTMPGISILQLLLLCTHRCTIVVHYGEATLSLHGIHPPNNSVVEGAAVIY